MKTTTQYSTLLFFLLFSNLALAAPLAVKVGVSPVVSSAGIFIAQERGYFQKQGLEIEITPFRSSTAPMTPLLAKGELDVGAGNITAGIWNANIDAASVKIVADKGTVTKGHSYIALVVRNDHLKSGRYKSFKDLKGFKLAFTALGGVSQEIVAEKILAKGGLSPNDVTYIKMPYAEMVGALRNKDLDASIVLEPYISVLELEKIATNVVPVFDIYPNQSSAAIFYSAKFATEKKEAAEKFMAAYLLGVRDYVNMLKGGADRKAVIEILKKHTDASSDELWEKMIPVGLNPDGFLNSKAIAADLEWYRAKNYVTKPVRIEAVLDHSFVEAAIKRIGRYAKKRK